jgi:hypothetical protein
MIFPELPKIHKKKEADFSIKFRHWLSKNPFKLQCWFEIKDTRGKNTFNLKEWKQEQRDFAESLKYAPKGILIRTEGITGLPDFKYAYKEPTFVVINYPQGFVIIEAETLAMQKGPSLSWDNAQDIAHHVV